MRLTAKQKNDILELSLKQAWVHKRKYLRRIFMACADNGWSIGGYKNLLEEATKIATRANEAIKILETE
jgi:hypothetical protein